MGEVELVQLGLRRKELFVLCGNERVGILDHKIKHFKSLGRLLLVSLEH